MTLHVCHVLLEPRMGGPQLRILAVAKALLPLGIRSTILLPEGPAPFRAYLEAAGLEVRQLPLHRFRQSPDPRLFVPPFAKLLPETRGLVRILDAVGADVIHTHGLYQLHGVLAAASQGIPLVWHLNDLLLPGWLCRALAPRILAASRAVIVVSEAVRRHTLGDLGVDGRVVTIYDPPVRVAPFQNPTGSETIEAAPSAISPALADRVSRAEGPSALPRVLTVGNLYRVKGHADLYRAIRLVKQPARFELVGSSLDSQPEVLRALVALEQEPGIRGRVTRLGWREDVQALLADSALYVHPSRTDACPLAVLEAMAAGLPVVATAVGGVPELVVDGETGLLVAPGDIGGLARAIDAVLADDRLRRRLGMAGRLRLKQHFSLDRCVRRHAAVYEAAVRGPLNVANEAALKD